MKNTIDTLRAIPEFSKVPADQLEWFLEHAELQEVKIGDTIFKKDDPIDKLYILLKGQVDIKVMQENNYRLISTIDQGGISGFLPYSRATTAIAEGIVVQDGYILKLSKPLCKEMALKHYELTAVFVHEMTSRTREFVKTNVQAEKMMALGKLSAGLAHELNNPASAILRSAKALKSHLSNVPEKFKAVMSMTVTGEQVDALNDLIFSKLDQQVHLSLMERSNREDEIEDWLEDQDLTDNYENIDTFVDYNFTPEDLEKILTITGKDNLSPSINWISNLLTTEKMVDEIDEASSRISELVQSVKIYTHMDNAPEKHKADIKKGIISTITMLNHKLKKKKIDIETNFEEDLPQACIMVSEVNQIWTNLIDNAIDAIEDDGKIEIRARRNNDHLTVEIIDNGEGIPIEKIDRIFDPFYTTKAIGEGTGMGLEVVHRIVSQHQGKINVTSKPGETKFIVDLPID